MCRIFLLVAAVLLGACSQTSELQRPEPPVPKGWFVNGEPAVGALDAPKTRWQDFFPDPQLRTLITMALENNRDLRIAAGRVLEARAQYGIAKADLGPSLNLLGSGNVTHSPTDVLNGAASSTSKRYDLSLSSISFELDFWGRVAGLNDAARLSYLATEEAQRAVYLSLVADVASAYFSVLQMKESHALALATLESHERSLSLIAKGRDLGGANDYEFQMARGQLEASRASLDDIEHQRTVATNRLNFLIGNAPWTLAPGRKLADQAIDDDLAPGLPSEALLLRPDVMAAEQRLRAAHANIGAARAAFLPKVLLTAGLGAASQGLLGLFTGGGAWAFQSAISMPLFDGGRTAAGVDIAEARKVIAVAEYERAIQLAFREVADLLSSRVSLSRQLRSSGVNAQAQEIRLKIAQGRYDAGLVSYLEVLSAQRDLASAQQQNTQVRRARLEATAQLYKALGGGNSLNRELPTVAATVKQAAVVPSNQALR